MKKKIIAIAIVISLVCVLAIVLVLKGSSKANRENKTTVKTGAGLSDKEYVDDEDTTSNVLKTTSEVDTDPTSITVLVNKEYKIASDYEPIDLVEPNITFSFNYKDEKRMLREEAAKQLELLFEEAKKIGHELLGVSGYRSYERQKTLYEFNLIKYGYEYTQLYSAMPGTSEHQTGLSIDISCKSMGGLLRTTFADTKEGTWVSENAHKYGYIVRYADDKTSKTGYAYEPWHIRYVGCDLAKFLYDNNMTLDEYYEYKLNIDIIDREQYAYYDDLLSRNKKGDINYSKAVLDDLLDKKDVEPLEKPEEPKPLEEPDDLLGGLDWPSEFEEDEDIEFTWGPIESPTQEPTIKPTNDAKPTNEPVGEGTQKPGDVMTPAPSPIVSGAPSIGGGGDKDNTTPKPGVGLGRP